MKMLYAINALKERFTTNLKLQLTKDHSDEEYGLLDVGEDKRRKLKIRQE